MKITDPEWILGQTGERIVRRRLEELGYFVVPTNLIEDGGAPALTGALRRITLPDFQVSRDGRSAWVEIKTKTSAVWYRLGHEWRQGINKNNWLAYLEVQNVTGIPGYLAVLQDAPTRTLLFSALDDLSPIAMTGSKAAYNGKELVYFRVSDFREIKFPNGIPKLPTIDGPRSWHGGVEQGNKLTLFD